MRQARSWLIRGAAGLSNMGLYLAFTSNPGLQEIIAGAVVGGLATAGVIVFSAAARARFEFRLRDVMQAWRLPWDIFMDSTKILQELAVRLFTRRGVPSVLAAVAFDRGDNNRALAAGRSALALTYNSVTPNSIMLGIVEDQHRMIFHQLIAGPLSPMIKDLEAKP